MCPNMQTEWHLNYARWVIEDGEPERRVGEVFDWFAVAFWTEKPLAKSFEYSRTAVPIDDYSYRVVAEVTYVSERACIIDFGLGATSDCDCLPKECREGDYVNGEIQLNLPLCTEVGPEEVFRTLARRWRVNRISADLTSYVPGPSGGLVRDSSNIKYEEVSDTESVRATSYVLHCSEA